MTSKSSGKYPVAALSGAATLKKDESDVTPETSGGAKKGKTQQALPASIRREVPAEVSAPLELLGSSSTEKPVSWKRELVRSALKKFAEKFCERLGDGLAIIVLILIVIAIWQSLAMRGIHFDMDTIKKVKDSFSPF